MIDFTEHLLVPLAFERIAAHWRRTYENCAFVNFVVTSLVTFVVDALCEGFATVRSSCTL